MCGCYVHKPLYALTTLIPVLSQRSFVRFYTPFEPGSVQKLYIYLSPERIINRCQRCTIANTGAKTGPCPLTLKRLVRLLTRTTRPIFSLAEFQHFSSACYFAYREVCRTGGKARAACHAKQTEEKTRVWYHRPHRDGKLDDDSP